MSTLLLFITPLRSTYNENITFPIIILPINRSNKASIGR